MSTAPPALPADPACGNWTIVSPSDGDGRPAQWDPVNARVLRFGGGGQLDAVPLMEFTIAGGWNQLTPAGNGPLGGRTYGGFVFDSRRNQMLVVGGKKWNGLAQTDVWALSLAGSPTWSSISTVGSPGALSRADFTTIYDPVRDRVIVYGGTVTTPGTGSLWELPLSGGGTPTWAQITPSGPAPPARAGHVAIYDPVRDRMIIHGGVGSGILSDTWALSFSGTPTWSQVSAPGAPAGVYSAAVYDPLRDRMVLLSGVDQAGVDTDHTWFLSLETQPFWSVLPPGQASLGARYGHAAVYEPNLDLILAIGGATGTGLFTDTRRLDCAGGWWLQTGAANGSVDVIPSKICYQPDEHVTLVASPLNGTMFNQWLGDASGSSNPIDVTMDGSKTIYAEIVPRTTNVDDVPVAFALGLRPNPSAGPVRIDYALPREGRVRLSVYDVAGREVARLIDELRPAGRYVASWNAAGVRAGAGVYLVRYETPAGTWTRRLAILQ